MTWFLNMRRARVGGGMYPEAYVVSGRSPAALQTVAWAEVARAVRGKHLLVFSHGFNVSMDSAIRGGVVMEDHLSPAPDELFLAVLWPGDWRVPYVNYSFEYDDAVEAGRLLARFLDDRCRGAATVSLGSHSLGGRVVLEALALTTTPIREVCVAAAAVDANSLSKKFAPLLRKVGRLSVLSSQSDQALRWAYPLGDFFSDVFGDDDSALKGALGLQGPRPTLGLPVHHDAIPKGQGYDHGHYFPGSPRVPGQPDPKWVRATDYWARALRGTAPLRW